MQITKEELYDDFIDLIDESDEENEDLTVHEVSGKTNEKETESRDEKNKEETQKSETPKKTGETYSSQKESNSKSSPYTPYHPVQETLESSYFPPGVLGFAKPSTGEAFVNPDVYGEMREVVKLHERLHLMYPHLDETSVRIMTNNLSGGPYVPTGRAY